MYLPKNTSSIKTNEIPTIKKIVERLELNNVEVEAMDATKLDPKYVAYADKVLIDVPCSGLGIIRRKPEIKYKSKAEIKDLPVLQRKILENASKYVKVGGNLLYSTCTILDSENIEVTGNEVTLHYSESKTETIEFTDLAGNKNTYELVVNYEAPVNTVRIFNKADLIKLPTVQIIKGEG